jgi:heat shock protein HtpX
VPFTFVDIEAARSRRVVLLFTTLVVFYFLGALLLQAALTLGGPAHYFSRGMSDPAAGSLRTSLRTLPRVFGGALVAAFVHWGCSVRNMIPRILAIVDARPLDPDDRHHRLLGNIVAELSAATGGRVFEAVTVNSRAMNAFALSDLRGRSVIGVTEALLVRLDRRQLEAVIAHEAGHVIRGDCLTTTISCSMAAVWAGLLRLSLPDRDDGVRSAVTSLPVRSLPLLAVIVLMRGLTLLLSIWISRQREYRADATAVRLTRDPLALAAALHVIAGDWRAGFRPGGDLAPIFIVDPRRSGQLVETVASRLLSTHPRSADRIALLLTLGHADERALTAGLGERPAPEAEMPLQRPGDQKRWLALEGTDWRGPFAAAELAALPWVSLFTRVADGVGSEPLPAWEHPQINLLLRHRQAGAGTPDACPKCGQPLRLVAYEGVPLRKCDGCRGRLVGRVQFSRILAREEQPASPEVRELARGIAAAKNRRQPLTAGLQPGRLRCPDCRAEMTRTLYHALLPHRLEIDRCESCGLLWLDERELELIEHFSSIGRA